MSNQIQNPNDQKKYDLAERTAVFGEMVIEFTKTLPDNPINRPLISQAVRSGTSIGANYMEADCAESKKDFRHKISIWILIFGFTVNCESCIDHWSLS